MAEPIDIILLSHNRLEHLRRTVEALRQRTPEPFRLTIVDNASDADTRRWLVEHRGWFHQLLPRPTNEHVPAFQHGIDATTSDPYIVSDPDLIVPALTPSWLEQLKRLMNRHPDFGLIGVDLDPSNFPAGLASEPARLLRQPGEVLDGGALVEGNVGSHFTLIRRSTLRTPYVSDRETCRSVRAAGYRTGYAPGVQALHVGFDDAELYPAYLWQKEAAAKPYYPSYGAAATTVERGTSLEALATAAPVISSTRRNGVEDAGLLELAWRTPCIGQAIGQVRTIWDPPLPLPIEAEAASAIVLLDPPHDAVTEWLHEARRLARRLVVLVCDLETVDGRLADELAGEAWTAEELPGQGEYVRALARTGDRLEELGMAGAISVVEHRESWLKMLAAGCFGTSSFRLFVFRRKAVIADDGTVLIDEGLQSRHAIPSTLRVGQLDGHDNDRRGPGVNTRLRRLLVGIRATGGRLRRRLRSE